MAGNHQIAAGIIKHLQASDRRTDQADADKSNTGAGAGNASPGAFTAAQRVGMLRNKRVEAAAEKLRILPGEGLAAKRSPQYAVVLIEYESTVIEIVNLETRTPGIIEPLRIEPSGLGLTHGIIPDGIIQNQRQHAVNRRLHRAINR